jgi:hypothetical protein
MHINKLNFLHLEGQKYILDRIQFIALYITNYANISVLDILFLCRRCTVVLTSVFAVSMNTSTASGALKMLAREQFGVDILSALLTEANLVKRFRVPIVRFVRLGAVGTDFG